MNVRVTGIFIGEEEVPEEFDISVAATGEPNTDAWHLALVDAVLDALEPVSVRLELDESAAERARRNGIREFKYTV